MNFQHISTNLKVRLSKHLKTREVHLPISRKTSKDNLPTSFTKFEKSTFENFGKLLKVDLLNIFRKWEDKISPSEEIDYIFITLGNVCNYTLSRIDEKFNLRYDEKKIDIEKVNFMSEYTDFAVLFTFFHVLKSLCT